jgi:hypothetical protein
MYGHHYKSGSIPSIEHNHAPDSTVILYAQLTICLEIDHTLLARHGVKDVRLASDIGLVKQ